MYFIFFLYIYFLFVFLEFRGNNSFEHETRSRKIYLFCCLFFCIYYTVILSCQYYVGTDYPTYLDLFSGKGAVNLYRRKGEYFFYYICLCLFKNGINPQFGFLLLSFIQFLCIYIVIRDCQFESLKIFIFVYLTVGVFLYNQTNVVRQYTAASIILLSYLCVYKRKYIYAFLLIILASFFHKSALIIFPFLPLISFFKKKRSLIFHVFELLLLLVLSRMNFLEYIVSSVPIISRYSHYLNSAWELKPVSLLNKMSKYIFIPLYLLSLLVFKNINRKTDVFIFQIGFFAFSFKLFGLTSSLIQRFSVYFDFFSILPLYYLHIGIINGKLKMKNFNLLIYSAISLLYVGFFFVKTIIMPIAEYDYHSILQVHW